MEDIKEYINDLIDTNNDGKVDKEDLDFAISSIKTNIKKYKKKYNNLKVKYQEAQELIKKWEKEYKELEREIEITTEKRSIDFKEVSHVSRKAIKEYVETMILSDPELNMKYVPDCIESKIWESIIFKALKSLEVTLDNISLELPGHSIKPILSPNCEELLTFEEEIVSL